jgi:hypothetical protein
MTVQLRNPYAAFTPDSGEILRQVTSATWVSGQPLIIDIPRGQDIDSLLVVVAGTITLSSAATTASAVAPAQLVSTFKWNSDGAKQFEDTTGILAAWGNFERSLARDIVAPGVGATTHTVRCSYRLDRVTPDGVRPKDSMLHSNQAYMGSMQLSMQLGTVASCYSNFGTGAVGSTSLTVTVYTVELQEGSPMGQTEQRWIRRHTLYPLVFSAANSGYVQQLPVNTYLRGVKLLGITTSTGEPTADLINNVIIRSGPNYRINTNEANLRFKNMTSFNIQSTQLSAIPGLSFADLLLGNIGGRRLNTLLNLWNASECVLQLDVDSGTTVYAQVINYDLLPAVDIPERRRRNAAMNNVRSFFQRVAAGPARK